MGVGGAAAPTFHAAAAAGGRRGSGSTRHTSPSVCASRRGTDELDTVNIRLNALFIYIRLAVGHLRLSVCAAHQWDARDRVEHRGYNGKQMDSATARIFSAFRQQTF